jgi:hypothetical protein
LTTGTLVVRANRQWKTNKNTHEEREVETLMERIEQMEVTKEAVREAEAKKPLDDFRKTV